MVAGGPSQCNKPLTITLALGAGLLGELLTRYIAPPTAFAQNQPAVTKEIRAQSFTFVDQADRTVGTLSVEPERGVGVILQEPREGQFRIVPVPMRIVLRDADGRELWSAGGNLVRPLAE